MKKIKKLLSGFIALAMILSILAGCTDTGTNDNTDETNGNDITAETPENTPETEPGGLKPEIEIISGGDRIYESMAEYVYIPDGEVFGEWQVVDFVRNIEDFDPALQNMDKESSYWLYVEFIEDGTATLIYSDAVITHKWTKGYIVDETDAVIPAYMIKQIDGTDYMFVEWKSGDYYIRGEKPQYYVFKKGGIEYDYPGHKLYPNEKSYKTVRGDITSVGKGEPVIALREPPADFSSYMHFDENSLLAKNEIWAYDMRSCDVSQMDLSVIESYNDISFDSNTKFPADSSKLPVDFDAEYMLEYNKNPGLGIRSLHEQGITGAGVGIAVIDQNLLVDHEQYKDNLMYYERIHSAGDAANMHGSAVSSIAVGKDTGVAPGAKLYYISSTFGHYLSNGDYEFDASIVADCILRVLEINKNLPENEKIRVISISRGYNQNDKGYKEITEAIDKANAENIFVITTTTDMYYKDFTLSGADRDYLANPDDVKSYTPASSIMSDFYANYNVNSEWYKKSTLFPMGSHTYASCTGTENYELAHNGGLSWAVPWCAGFYALCCQVKPDITPQEFIEILNSTSTPASIFRNGKTNVFGNIVNPAEVIKILQSK